MLNFVLSARLLLRNVLVIGMLLPALASAVPFQLSDWKTVGDNLLVEYVGPAIQPPYGAEPYDTQHLEWLNVGLTLGKSYNEVYAQTTSGGAYEGFRFATAHEIVGLFRGPLGYADWMIQQGEDPANILQFASLLSIPSGGLPGCCFYGALYDYPQSDPEVTAGTLIFGAYGASSINQVLFKRSFTAPGVGSFLVREVPVSVPEPSSIALIGLVGVAVLIRPRPDRGQSARSP